MSDTQNNNSANRAPQRELVQLEDIKKDIERSKNRSFYGMLMAICIAIVGILGFAYMSISTVNDAENSVRTANEVSTKLGEVTARLEDTKRQVDDYKVQLGQLSNGNADVVEMDRLKQKLASLSSEYNKLEETETALRREKIRLEARFEVAQSDVLAALDKNEGLRVVIEQSSNSLTQARKEQSEAEKKLAIARSAQQRSSIALLNANNSNKSIQNELITTRRLQKNTQTALNKVQRLITVGQPSYPDLRAELARSKRSQRRTQSALDQAKRQLANSGPSGLRRALNRAKADVVERNRTIATQNRTIRSLKASLNRCSSGSNAQLNRQLRSCLGLVKRLRQRVVQ